MARPLERGLAATLAILIAALAPGLAPYEALAQTVGQGAATSAAGAPSSAAGGAANSAGPLRLPATPIGAPVAALGPMTAEPAPTVAPVASLGEATSGGLAGRSPAVPGLAGTTGKPGLAGASSTVDAPLALAVGARTHAAATPAAAAPSALAVSTRRQGDRSAEAATAAAPTRLQSAVARVSSGLRSVGKVLADAARIGALDGGLSLVFENGGRAAEDGGVRDSGSRRKAIRGLKPAPKGAAAKRRVYAADDDPAKAAEIEAAAYVKLKTNLEKMGLAPYQTKAVSRKVSDDRPTVAILAPASTHKLTMALEGGRQSAGDVHLVLDPSWLIQERHVDGRTGLLMTKGVHFTASGQAVVVEYREPRKVRYFANYYTLGANDRADGVPLEENLDVPQSSSLELEAITNDKLRTRLMMAARGVPVPATLALVMPQHPLAAETSVSPSAPSVRVERLAEPSARGVRVQSSVSAYLDRFPGSEVVVKPSGPQFHSGRGVKFFKIAERQGVISHAFALTADPMMTQDGVVLVDERVPSLEIRRDRLLETTLRVLVARTPWGEPVTTGVFARVGPMGKPTTAEAADPRDNATVESWQGLLEEWVANGQLTPKQAADLDDQVRRLGPAAFDAIAAHERTLPRKAGEPFQAQTDLIGLDVMIGRYDDQVKPVVIEVNDHDSGGQYNMEFALKEGSEHSAALVATWLARARRDALKGKRIVLIGAGYPGNAGYQGKRLFFDRAKELGVQVVLIDKPGSWAADQVAEFIPIDTTQPEEALAEAKKKLLKSARKNGKLDGITTFWEDDVTLTAHLARALGLKYHSPEAAEAARNKFALRTAMEAAGLPSPAYGLVKTRQALEELFTRRLRQGNPFPFPAVLKPARGAAAQGTKKAHNEAEALRIFDEIYADMDPANDPIFKQGREVLIDEYLDGIEGDDDIVYQDGKASYSKLTDNWPTREPYFLATGSSSPSRMLEEKQKAEILDLAERTLKAGGFSDGVFHVEYKVTSKGPRLIEVNARPGGVYVVPWNLQVWGVDLAEMLYLTAAGIPAVPWAPAQPRTYLEGEFLIPGISGRLERFHMDPEGSEEGFHDLLTLKLVGAEVSVPPNGYDRVGMLAARGLTSEDAQSNLAKQRERLRLVVMPK